MVRSRVMRHGFALWAASLVLLSVVAVAQPKRGAREAKDKDKDVEDKSAATKDDKAAPSRAEKAPPTTPAPAGASASDLGGPPTKPSSSAEPRSSPLNPEANEFADGGAAPPPADYDKLLGDIAALRSRVSALTTTLFASKVRVVVETRGDDASIASFAVTLDDGVVFAAPDRFSAEDERTVYEHAVAPGHHVLGVDIERYDVRGKEYRTWQSSRFSIVIPESKLLDAHLSIRDSSDMAKNFPGDQDGEYDLRVKLRARVAE